VTPAANLPHVVVDTRGQFVVGVTAINADLGKDCYPPFVVDNCGKFVDGITDTGAP